MRRRAGLHGNVYKRLHAEERRMVERYASLPWPRDRLEQFEAGESVVLQGWQLPRRERGGADLYDSVRVDPDGAVTPLPKAEA